MKSLFCQYRIQKFAFSQVIGFLTLPTWLSAHVRGFFPHFHTLVIKINPEHHLDFSLGLLRY